MMQNMIDVQTHHKQEVFMLKQRISQLEDFI